jgi:hypothetical protein
MIQMFFAYYFLLIVYFITSQKEFKTNSLNIYNIFIQFNKIFLILFYFIILFIKYFIYYVPLSYFIKLLMRLIKFYCKFNYLKKKFKNLL